MSNYSSGYSPIANFVQDSVQYGKLAEQSVKDRYGEVNTAMIADGLVKNTLTEADATKKMAKYEAEAVKARGAAAGKAAIWKGVGSAAGSIGSSIAGNMGKDPFIGNPGSLGTPGFGMTPNTQVEIGYGGGTHNGFGTYGPNWGY